MIPVTLVLHVGTIHRDHGTGRGQTPHAGYRGSRKVPCMSVSDHLDGMIGDSGIGTRGATVAGLQRALSSGSLTSAGLTAFYLDRIERLNPDLHAVISVSPHAAADAAGSDAARARGASRGPLEGIPVLIKDNIAVAGRPATAGSPALADAESGDAFLVARLRAAGAVILGKANLSEWANFRSPHSTSGWSTLGGQAVNPHGTGRNPSGSSSGSAVALAAALAPLAVGTETDGSIVSPSSACGVVGLKPTVGLISRSGIVPISAAQDTAGPMARCVADAAALLGGMAGPDDADPGTVQPGSPATGASGVAGASRATGASGVADYTMFLDPDAAAGARLGVWRDGSAKAGPATTAVLDAAVARLRARGAEIIDPVQLPDTDKISEPEFAALLNEFRHDLDAYLGALGGEHPASLADLIRFNDHHRDQVLVHFGQEWFEQAAATSGSLADPEYLAARGEARRLAAAALDGALGGHRLDAVIALTSSPAWLTDHILGDRDAFGTSTPCAVSGYPAISVPAGLVSGLPVGVTFMGPPWSEPRLIALAHSFEQSR
jgi:amidase